MAGIDYKICDERESFSALIVQMPKEEQKLYQSFGHNRAEPVFMKRVFCLYQSNGLDEGKHPVDPTVVSKIQVTGLTFDVEKGFEVTFQQTRDNHEIINVQRIGASPEKLFGHNLFASVPCSFGLKRSHVIHTSGNTSWDVSAVVYLKTANRADFYHKGDLQMETPAKFRRLYPNFKWSV